MSLTVINHISNMFDQVIGSPALIGLFILSFLVIGLVIMRAHIWVMLAIILPVVLVFAFDIGQGMFMTKGFAIILIFILAFGLGGVFLYFQR